MLRLEESIVQAQNREGLILDMTQWMVEMNDLLQSRIDADILAGDVPEEYEVAVCHFPISRFSVLFIFRVHWHQTFCLVPHLRRATLSDGTNLSLESSLLS